MADEPILKRRTPSESAAYFQGMRAGLRFVDRELRKAGFVKSCGSCNGCGCENGPHQGDCSGSVCPDCDGFGDPVLAVVEHSMKLVRGASMINESLEPIFRFQSKDSKEE